MHKSWPCLRVDIVVLDIGIEFFDFATTKQVEALPGQRCKRIALLVSAQQSRESRLLQKSWFPSLKLSGIEGCIPFFFHIFVV